MERSFGISHRALSSTHVLRRAGGMNGGGFDAREGGGRREEGGGWQWSEDDLDWRNDDDFDFLTIVLLVAGIVQTS